ncbi:hypothetical protein [Amphibacillus cookii]|nr:hypothetical protein [Amphibacillus cookii]MBM7540089.1 hypothetical protein [Amphibacillus cookii]
MQTLPQDVAILVCNPFKDVAVLVYDLTHPLMVSASGHERQLSPTPR